MFKGTKISKLLLSLVMGAMVFTGCGNKAATTTANNDSTKKDKVIRVGTSGEYLPWTFKEGGELKGFEIDVWNEIGKRTGYKVEFKVSKFSGLFGMLDAGQIDTIAHQISTTCCVVKDPSYCLGCRMCTTVCMADAITLEN